jgi:hypothetical protein
MLHNSQQNVPNSVKCLLNTYVGKAYKINPIIDEIYNIFLILLRRYFGSRFLVHLLPNQFETSALIIVNNKIRKIIKKVKVFLFENKVNIKAIKAEKKVIGVEEIIAVYSSIPEFSQAGTKTIEPPIPNIPTRNPAKNPEIIQFHIFLELILSVYLRKTKPCFCF